MLLECPTTFLSFVIRQHAHLFSRHFLACSCLHMGHAQACVAGIFFLGAAKYLASTIIHKVTTDIPITKKIVSVLILIRRTSSEMANMTVEIAIIKSQRCVKSNFPFNPSCCLACPQLRSSASSHSHSTQVFHVGPVPIELWIKPESLYLLLRNIAQL